MDPLDDVFSAMRVHSAVYARVQAHWGLSLAGGPSARFGLVVQGACLLQVEGTSEPVPLIAGDCFVIARGTPYVLCDELASPRVRCADVVRDKIGGLVELGNDREGSGSATVICGWFTFDALSARPLMELMPALFACPHGCSADASFAGDAATVGAGDGYTGPGIGPGGQPPCRHHLRAGHSCPCGIRKGALGVAVGAVGSQVGLDSASDSQRPGSCMEH
jgi:Cupin